MGRALFSRCEKKTLSPQKRGSMIDLAMRGTLSQRSTGSFPRSSKCLPICPAGCTGKSYGETVAQECICVRSVTIGEG